MEDTKFKKGNKFGKGRPKLSDLTKQVRSQCMKETAQIIEALSLPHDEAKKVMTSASASMLMNSVFKSIEKGDRKIIMDLLNRFLPKPKEEKEESTSSSKIIQLAYKL